MIHSCPVCREAKKVRRAYNTRKETVKARRPGEVMCMDICKFMSPSIGRNTYLLVMINEYSRFMVVFSIVNISDATQEIIDFVTLAENCCELRMAENLKVTPSRNFALSGASVRSLQQLRPRSKTAKSKGLTVHWWKVSGLCCQVVGWRTVIGAKPPKPSLTCQI